VSWLALLRSQWLANLEPRPFPHVLVPARDKGSDARGTALVVREGVLFIPAERTRLALEAVAPRGLTAPPTLEQFLHLVAHVPDGRWNALGEHLAAACDGAWLARGMTVDESSGEFLTLTGSQRADEAPPGSTRGRWALAQLQLAFTLDSNGLARREAVTSLLAPR
jgi:hypothetical protein